MRTTDPALVLFGQARRLVLGWLYGHPDEAYYLRAIARQTGLPVGSIQGELEQLTAAGLVTRTRQGRQVYFRADRSSPIFQELRSLLVKTSGIAGTVREALEALRDRIRVALIFGSAARQELRRDSDIDVMVIGDVSFVEVVDALAEAQVRIGRDVNPSVYPVAEYAAKLQGGHHFLTALQDQPRIFLIGDDHELGRLGTELVADSPQLDKARNRRPAGRVGKRPARQPRRRAES